MFQKVMLVGRLGQDPETSFLEDGTQVTNFSLATDNYIGGENRTAWFRVSVWGNQAQAVSEYLSKGDQAIVDGTLQFDSDTGGPKLFDRKNGSVGASFEVRAFNVRFGQKGEPSSDSAASSGSGLSNESSGWEEEDDEIPF